MTEKPRDAEAQMPPATAEKGTSSGPRSSAPEADRPPVLTLHDVVENLSGHERAVLVAGGEAVPGDAKDAGAALPETAGEAYYRTPPDDIPDMYLESLGEPCGPDPAPGSSFDLTGSDGADLPPATLPADRTIDRPADALRSDAPQIEPGFDLRHGGDAAPAAGRENVVPADAAASVAPCPVENAPAEPGRPEPEAPYTAWAPSPAAGDAAQAVPAAATGDGAPPPPPVPPAGEKDVPPDEKPMSLLEHLGELRSRLVRSFIAVLLAFFVCYSFAKELFHYLSLPLLAVMPADAKFIYTGVAEGFFVDLKVGFVAAVFAASPFLFYQIWAFIAPGLYEDEKRHIVPLAMCSALFFLGGAAFCYFVVFPFAFVFFLSYSTDNIVAMLSISEYLSFALKMLVAFGLIFEMPLFTFFLARMGLVTAKRMRDVRKYAVLAVFIVAAILTPPDVFSQLLMALPMLVLYEVSIFVAVFVGKKERNVPEAPGKTKPTDDAGEEA